MGFGLLFIGYFMTYLMSVNKIGFLMRLAGYAVVLFSCTRLRRYNKAFELPMYFSVVMIISSALDTFFNVERFLYNNLFIDKLLLPDSFEVWSSYVDTVLVLVFHVCLLYAIRAIAKETEDAKVSYASSRNLIIIIFYYVLYGISLLPFSFVEDYVRYFSLPVTLLYFVWIVMNAFLIYTCYARICDENDVEMPLKKSRFEFVNRFREKTAEREQKAADDTVEYAKKKLQERKEKRNKKK